MMKPRERFLNVLKGQKTDIVPIWPCDLMENGKGILRGDTPRQEIFARVVHLCPDYVTAESHINRYLVSPPRLMSTVKTEESQGEITTTSVLATPRGNLTYITKRDRMTRTVWTVKYPVETLADLDCVASIPWELPHMLKPLDSSSLPADFSENYLARTVISSPFVCVAGLMPYGYFLELCTTEYGLIKDLTAECQRRVLAVLDVLLAPKNIDYIKIGGCEWLTPPMGSPRLYDELVQAYEPEIIRRIHRAGAVCHIHCHGRIRSTLEKMIERGADYTEPVEPPPNGDLTFAEAKELAAGRVTLGGNIEASLLQYGTPDEVECAVRAAFAGSTERMILQDSVAIVSEIDPMLRENYRRMIDVWEGLAGL